MAVDQPTTALRLAKLRSASVRSVPLRNPRHPHPGPRSVPGHQVERGRPPGAPRLPGAPGQNQGVSPKVPPSARGAVTARLGRYVRNGRGREATAELQRREFLAYLARAAEIFSTVRRSFLTFTSTAICTKSPARTASIVTASWNGTSSPNVRIAKRKAATVSALAQTARRATPRAIRSASVGGRLLLKVPGARRPALPSGWPGRPTRSLRRIPRPRPLPIHP